MAIAPCARHHVQGLHRMLIVVCTRRSCGLSFNARTLFMLTGREDCGLGIDSAYHAYVYTVVQAMEELLGDPGDRGGWVARGLWGPITDRERVYTGSGNQSLCEVTSGTMAQLPFLTVRLQLMQVGVTGAYGAMLRPPLQTRSRRGGV
eukprot:9355876-Pyramimonas_sp.AAC.1